MSFENLFLAKLCVAPFIRAYPHLQKSCLFRQIFCRRQRLTSADGLSRPDKRTADKICPG